MPSLAWPLVFVIALYAFRLDILIARTVGAALLAFLVILVSLSSVAATLGGAWAFGALPEYFLTEGDLLNASPLLTIGVYYVFTLGINVILIARTYRAGSDERRVSVAD